MNTTLCLAAKRCLRQPPQKSLPSQILSLQSRKFGITPRKSFPTTTPQASTATPRKSDPAPTYLGTTKRLPEFNLAEKVVLISGAARGLGLVQAEALLEAGAIVYALDRLETPSPNFSRIQTRASTELGTSLHYRRIDVRDVSNLNAIVEEIANTHGRLDGLIAAAGIQQETPALEYTAEDCDLMLGVNVTGCFMTAQAVAKQMVRFGSGGSIVMIASMSGTVANRVGFGVFGSVPVPVPVSIPMSSCDG